MPIAHRQMQYEINLQSMGRGLKIIALWLPQ